MTGYAAAKNIYSISLKNRYKIMDSVLSNNTEADARIFIRLMKDSANTNNIP